MLTEGAPYRRAFVLAGDAMTLPPLWIVRHGQTEWNAAGRLQGSLDSPLTALGRDQARAMTALLVADGVSAASHAAVTSPQGRAVDTAALMLAPLGLTARPDARLAEYRLGPHEGLTRDDIDAAHPEIADLAPWDWYDALPGAEGLAQLAARLAPALQDLDRPTVIVAHGIVSRVLRCLVLGLPLAEGARLPGGQGVIYRVADGDVTALGRPGGTLA